MPKKAPKRCKCAKRPSRPLKLAEAAKQALIKQLEEGAVVAGFSMEQRTQAQVRKAIEREFEVIYHHYIVLSADIKDGWLHDFGQDLQTTFRWLDQCQKITGRIGTPCAPHPRSFDRDLGLLSYP